MSKYVRGMVCGVGINDANYEIYPSINGKQVMCPHYKAWRSMITRCYSERLHNEQPEYIGCTVAKEWHSFMAFRKWMMSQDWQEKDLDKDIIEPGNRVYSPEKCVFVSQKINKLLTDSKGKRGKWPQGVYLDKKSNRFMSQIQRCGKIKRLGTFDSPEEASKVYRRAKYLHILTVACCESDVRVKQGLYRHSQRFIDREQI